MHTHTHKYTHTHSKTHDPGKRPQTVWRGERDTEILH